MVSKHKKAEIIYFDRYAHYNCADSVSDICSPLLTVTTPSREKQVNLEHDQNRPAMNVKHN